MLSLLCEDDFRKLITLTVEHRLELLKVNRDRIARSSREAVALERESVRLKECILREDSNGNADAARMHSRRLAVVSVSRCAALLAVAVAAKACVLLASGDLAIDESTVGTGLTEQERRTIDLVRRAGDDE